MWFSQVYIKKMLLQQHTSTAQILVKIQTLLWQHISGKKNFGQRALYRKISHMFYRLHYVHLCTPEGFSAFNICLYFLLDLHCKDFAASLASRRFGTKDTPLWTGQLCEVHMDMYKEMSIESVSYPTMLNWNFLVHTRQFSGAQPKLSHAHSSTRKHFFSP